MASQPEPATPTGDVVLYDGLCGLCSRVVPFIARHDARGRFRFAPLDSDVARSLLASAPALPAVLPDSVVLVDASGAVLVESDAALRILAGLDGRVRHLARLRVVPRPVRNAVYRLVARTRYRIFGRFDVCAIPAPWLRDRFLDGA